MARHYHSHADSRRKTSASDEELLPGKQNVVKQLPRKRQRVEDHTPTDVTLKATRSSLITPSDPNMQLSNDVVFNDEERLNHQQRINALNDYIKQMSDDNVRLAMEKAAAATQRADYHRRYTEMTNQYAIMVQSYAKRVEEKDVVVQENVQLLEANAALRSQNADFLAEALAKDRRIEQLQMENAGLMAAQHHDTEELERMKSKIDQKNNECDQLQRRVKAMLADMRKEDRDTAKRAQSQAQGQRNLDQYLGWREDRMRKPHRSASQEYGGDGSRGREKSRQNPKHQLWGGRKVREVDRGEPQVRGVDRGVTKVQDIVTPVLAGSDYETYQPTPGRRDRKDSETRKRSWSDKQNSPPDRHASGSIGQSEPKEGGRPYQSSSREQEDSAVRGMGSSFSAHAQRSSPYGHWSVSFKDGKPLQTDEGRPTLNGKQSPSTESSTNGKQPRNATFANGKLPPSGPKAERKNVRAGRRE